MKEFFDPNDNKFHFISGFHFTTYTVESSSKSSIETCVGCTIIKLGKTVLRKVIKTTIIVGKWLNYGEPPSGRSLEDLYARIIEVHKENMFIGFMAFICLKKYNNGITNNVTVLQIKSTIMI